MKVLSKKYLFLANEPVILEKELCIEYGHRGLYQDLQKRVLYRVRRYIWIIASVILGILAYLLIFSSSTSAHNKIVRNNITQLTFWFFENGDITNIGTIIFEIILSLAVTVFLWHLTKPSIDVSVVEDKAGKESKYLHVKVSNKGRFLFINRETTYETTGEITFTNMNTNLTSQSYFPKWASKSNQLSPVVIPSNVSVSGRPTAHIRYSFDETKIANSKIEDIYSGSSKFLDIAEVSQ